MTQFMKVATLNEIPAVSIEGLKVEGHDIVLVNSGGQIYALSNICTHAFCYMSYGQVEDTPSLAPATAQSSASWMGYP